MAEHLKLHHQIDINTGSDINNTDVLQSSKPSTASYMTASPRTSSMPFIGKKPFEQFQYLLVWWIVTSPIAFSVVENLFFRELLH